MSDDIKHLAHSILNRAGQHRPSMPKGQSAQNAQLASHVRSGLPEHLVHHAHAYVTKILQAKGAL